MVKRTVNSEQHFKDLIHDLNMMWHEHHYLVIDMKSGKTRSDPQRKAIEVYCRELADALNAAGLDQRAVIKAMSEDGIDIPWSQESVKDALFRPIMRHLLDKESTTKLERSEVSRVHDVLNRWTATTFGVSMDFPHREE